MAYNKNSLTSARVQLSTYGELCEYFSGNSSSSVQVKMIIRETTNIPDPEFSSGKIRIEVSEPNARYWYLDIPNAKIDDKIIESDGTVWYIKKIDKRQSGMNYAALSERPTKISNAARSAGK